MDQKAKRFRTKLPLEEGTKNGNANISEEGMKKIAGTMGANWESILQHIRTNGRSNPEIKWKERKPKEERLKEKQGRKRIVR